MVNVRTSTISRPILDTAQKARGAFEGVCSLAILLCALLLLFSDAAASMISIWLTSSAYHHGIVVAPISLWLIATNGHDHPVTNTGDWRGVAVILAAALLWLAGHAAMIELFGHLAVVTAIIGSIIAVYGWPLARQWSFPLAFLFFMVPVGAEFAPTLQALAAKVVAPALSLTGIATSRDGFMLTTAAGRFEVAESCAGLRFLLASAMISTLVSWRAFSTFPKRAAFVVAALIAALLANWLRIYFIVLVATLTENRFGVGPEHVAIGWAFYGALLAALILFARRFQDRTHTPAIAPASPTTALRPTRRVLVAAIAIAAGAALYNGAFIAAAQTATAEAIAPFRVSSTIQTTTPFTDWRAFAPSADKSEAFSYISASGPGIISVATFAFERPGAEAVSANVRAADGVRWRRIAIAEMDLNNQGVLRRARLETLANNFGEKIEVATLYRIDDQLLTSALAVKMAGAARRLSGRPVQAATLFIAAPKSLGVDPHAAIREIARSIELGARNSAHGGS